MTGRATASVDLRSRLRGVLRELATATRETALLTAPGWMPARPVELVDVDLTWVEGPQPTTIDGAEAEAQALCPLRTARYRFDRYTSAIRYVDTPALFENRPSYRLLDVSWSESGGRLHFGLAAYFDKLDICEAVGHEYAAAVIASGPDGAPSRRSIWSTPRATRGSASIA